MFSSLPFGFMFIFVTLFGTIFSLSSSHWLGVWAGLEINLIGFLPILVYQKSNSESESAVKYFVIQALGSGLLIFGSLTGCNLSFTWDLIMNSSISSFIIILSGLVIKMGMFPFHFWLPSVMAGLPWFSCLFLATWQKIAPLLLVSSLIEMSMLYSFMVFFCFMASISSLIGGIGGMNQTQVRALLAYSSIGHLGWIMFAASQSMWSMKSYFLIYVLISLSVFMSLWYLNLSHVKNLSDLMTFDPYKAFSLMIMLLSLGGLPPLLGFISKWMVIFGTMQSNYWMFLFILILGSVMSLFYYLGLYFSISLGLSKKLYMNTKPSSGTTILLTTGLLMNLLGGLALIFLNLLKEF